MQMGHASRRTAIPSSLSTPCRCRHDQPQLTSFWLLPSCFWPDRGSMRARHGRARHKHQQPMRNVRLPPPTPLPGSLAKRTLNALGRHGITSVEQVVWAYPERLLRLAGFGLTALRDVERVLFPWRQYTPMRLRRSTQSKAVANTERSMPGSDALPGKARKAPKT